MRAIATSRICWSWRTAASTRTSRWGVRASPGWRSTRPGSLPRTAWVRSWRASRARPVRATQVALGGAERVDQGSARIPTIHPARLGEGARRVGSGVLGVEHQADGDAGHVLRHVLVRQRTGSAARSAHRARRETRISCVPAFPCGTSIPESGRLDVDTRAKTPPLRRSRANRPASRLLRRTLLVSSAVLIRLFLAASARSPHHGCTAG